MKKVISNLILFLIFSICSYLLIANVLHVGYLNKHEMYDFSGNKFAAINTKIVDYQSKLDKVNRLNTKLISGENLSTIKTELNAIMSNIETNPLLKYSGNTKFYVKDYFKIDALTKTNTLATMNILNILTEYDSNIKNYLEVYKVDIADDMLASQDRFLRGFNTYKYNTTVLTSGDYVNVVDYGILSRVMSLENSVTKANYLADLVLELGGDKNE